MRDWRLEIRERGKLDTPISNLLISTFPKPIMHRPLNLAKEADVTQKIGNAQLWLTVVKVAPIAKKTDAFRPLLHLATVFQA